MIIVGLTGGIASGKSTVAKIFADCDANIIDADEICHELQKPGMPAVKELASVWPDVVTNNVLDRERLSKIVFGDPKARRKVNSIMNRRILHALFIMLVRCWYNEPRNRIVVLDLPLLYETKLFKYIACSVVVVFCHSEVQLKRLQARNGYTETEAQTRISAQMPLSKKRALADFVIHNDADDDESSLKIQVSQTLRTLSNKSPLISSTKLILLGIVCVGIEIGSLFGYLCDAIASHRKHHAD